MTGTTTSTSTTGATSAVGSAAAPGAPRDGAEGARGARPPSCVVLDVGNVLYAWDPAGAVVGRVSRDTWEDFVHRGGFARWNTMLDAGTPFEEVAAALTRACPDHPEWVKVLATYREHFLSALTGPVPGTAEVVDDLLEAGVALYALTNFEARSFARARHLLPWLERFKGVVVSGEEGLVKPDPGLYQVLVRRYGLDPARTVLVDDSADNVRTARELGMTGLHFTGAGRLRLDLTALGLLPPCAGPTGS